MQVVPGSVNKAVVTLSRGWRAPIVAADLQGTRHSMRKPRTSVPLEHWIGYRFSLISARLGNFIAQMYASRHDLTMPAWRSLAVIARHQPLTATQLGKLTSSDPYKVTRAIELLVRRGLIRRDNDRADRRRASLRLTAQGRKVYQDIEKFVVRVERELTSAFNARELSALRQSLDTLDRQLEHVRSRDWEKFLKN
jgi:DNA-binding MarR family transcriptional regulator